MHSYGYVTLDEIDDTFRSRGLFAKDCIRIDEDFRCVEICFALIFIEILMLMHDFRRLEIHWLLIHRSEVIIGNIIERIILRASCAYTTTKMLRVTSGLISIDLNEVGLLRGGGMAAILVDSLGERLGTIVVERHLRREDAGLRVIIGLLGIKRVTERLGLKREIVEIFGEKVLLLFKSSWLVLESLVKELSVNVLVGFFLLVVFKRLEKIDIVMSGLGCFLVLIDNVKDFVVFFVITGPMCPF